MGGVGGGGLVIPFVILFNNFNAQQVAQQAPFYNLVSAAVRYIINIPKTSPIKPEKTIIDYDMVAIFVPLNLFGANIGGIFNVIFPNFITDVCLFLFLVFVIYKLFDKAVETYKKESAKMAKEQMDIALVAAEAVQMEPEIGRATQVEKEKFIGDVIRATQVKLREQNKFTEFVAPAIAPNPDVYLQGLNMEMNAAVYENYDKSEQVFREKSVVGKLRATGINAPQSRIPGDFRTKEEQKAYHIVTRITESKIKLQGGAINAKGGEDRLNDQFAAASLNPRDSVAMNGDGEEILNENSPEFAK